MAKNILFCADGTWNGPDDDEDKDGVPDITNVLKIFFNLDGQNTLGQSALDNEQERTATNASGETIQIAKYLHGVGDSNNWLNRMLGGGFGMGVISRIVRGYTFLSRHYQPGDRIFLIGFSRGAYTARALGGMIVGQGLFHPATVNFADKAEVYRLGVAAWHRYRKQQTHTANAHSHSFLPHLAELLAELPGWFARDLTDADFVPANIEGIGVWDTVGAMGIPVFREGEQVDLFRFADNRLSPKVAHGLHLVSVDERRGDFAPTFWDPRDGVTQILMPGAHSDVGGGYPVQGNQSGLSDGGLNCMTNWCRNLGVRFSATPDIVAHPDPMHGVAHKPWNSPPFDVMPQRSRDFPDHMCVHVSVLERWNAPAVVANPGEAPAPYRPTNLGSFLQPNGQLIDNNK
ncbi:MAG: DUF2235 domain-containing protein [Magnetococcales bacterium]|nr:DUF2235 domain-containing protein [Magnetococcales bacterium]